MPTSSKTTLSPPSICCWRPATARATPAICCASMGCIAMHPMLAQHFAGVALAVAGRQQQMLGGDKVVFELVGILLRRLHRFGERLSQKRLAAGDFGLALQPGVELTGDKARGHTNFFEQ